MATLHITEFRGSGRELERAGPTAVLPPITTQTVTYTTSTASDDALNASTRLVRLIADADCYIDVAVSPTATASSMRLEADVAEYFAITQTGYKIAAYDGTS